MTDEKKRKKAAQAVQALLELDGIKATVKEVAQKIEGENLTDIVVLKDKLANDMRPAVSKTVDATDRRRIIGDFVVTNWDLLKDNEVVKGALLNAYCMGRYKKEQRETMARELLSQVGETNEASENTESVSEVVDDVKEDEPLDHRQYTF
jgi:ABC-type polar amino acid transport system ATPase subunit